MDMPDTNLPWNQEGVVARLASQHETMKAILHTLDGIRSRFEVHEQREFAYHDRVEEHMAQTMQHIAQANASREGQSIRLAHLEGRMDAFETEVREGMDRLKARVLWLFGAAGIAGGLGAFLAVELFRHLTTGPK